VHRVVGVPLQLTRNGAVEVSATHEQRGHDRDDGDEYQERAEGLREGLHDHGEDRDSGEDDQHSSERRQQDPVHLPSMSVTARHGAAD
jgi:hypothetical protein